MLPASDTESSEESESEEESEDSDDDGIAMQESEEAKAERLRLHKRREVVLNAIFRILKKYDGEIPSEELADRLQGKICLIFDNVSKILILFQRLIENGVKNFRPEIVGYESTKEFLKAEQGRFFKYEDGMILTGTGGAVEPPKPARMFSLLFFV